MTTKAKKNGAGERKVELPETPMEHMVVHIVGESPLLVNRFGEKAKAQIESDQQNKAKGAQEPRSPEEEVRDKLYLLDPEQDENRVTEQYDDEQYGFRAVGIKKSIVTASYRLGDQNGGTTLRGAVFVNPRDGTEMIEILANGYSIDSRKVSLSGRGGWSIAYRPKFWPWEMRVPFDFNRNLVSPDQLLHYVALAGRGQGIGSYRPESNGPFGRFDVEGAMME